MLTATFPIDSLQRSRLTHSNAAVEDSMWSLLARSKTRLLHSTSAVSLHFDILRILKRQKRHKVCVMHNVCFCRALHQIALGGVGGNNVAYGVGDAAFQCECDSGKGMA